MAERSSAEKIDMGNQKSRVLAHALFRALPVMVAKPFNERPVDARRSNGIANTQAERKDGKQCE
jgi:hypothetical protein